MAGRPTKFTPETIEVILKAIEFGHGLHEAAASADVHHETIRQWRLKAEAGEEDYVAFFGAIKKAETVCQTQMLSHIKTAAMNDTWQAAAWILERRFPKLWSQRVNEHIREEMHATLEHLQKTVKADTYAEVIRAMDGRSSEQGSAYPRGNHGAKH